MSQTLTESKEKVATMVFTTLDDDTSAPFTETLTIFSKRANYDQLCAFSEEEQKLLRKAIEDLKMDAEIRPWLYKAMKLKREGKKVLFLSDRLSLLTYKRGDYNSHPGLWDMVMCEHDMRHNQTKDVSEDYGEKTPHDGSLDVWLRNRVHKAQLRMFIKIAHAYPEIWKDLESRDGEEVNVSYDHNTLHLHLPATNTSYTMNVGKIRLVNENAN